MYKAKIMTPESIARLRASSAWSENAQALLAEACWEDALGYLVNEYPAEQVMRWILQRLQADLATLNTLSGSLMQEVAAWLKTPDENGRWRIFRQAEELGFDTPAGALGLALFWMEGSMTPAEFEAVYPEKHLTPLMLHCALKLLCIRLAGEQPPVVGAQSLVSQWIMHQGGH